MVPPPLCANGCGFYGSASNNNFCSKCYKDHLKEHSTQHIEGETFVLGHHESCAKNSESPIFNNNNIDDICDAIDAITLTHHSYTSMKEIEIMKNNKNRCKSCNKRIGLTGFECRCGDVFCGSHRYPEVHACNVDFKNIGRQTLAKQNPKCVHDKLECRV